MFICVSSFGLSLQVALQLNRGLFLAARNCYVCLPLRAAFYVEVWESHRYGQWEKWDASSLFSWLLIDRGINLGACFIYSQIKMACLVSCSPSSLY